MSAQKVHRMKLKKAAASGSAHIPLARRDKKHQKGQALLYQQNEAAGEASVSLLAGDSPADEGVKAVPVTKQEPKPTRRSIRKVFGFGRSNGGNKSKNKSKKHLGYTLTKSPKMVKDNNNNLPEPAPVSTSCDSPTGITPKNKRSPFHQEPSPKPSIHIEEKTPSFVANWNPSFHDDLVESKESEGPNQQSLEDAATPSIELTYNTGDVQEASLSPAVTSPIVNGSASKSPQHLIASPKVIGSASKSPQLAASASIKTPKSTTSRSSSGSNKTPKSIATSIQSTTAQTPRSVRSNGSKKSSSATPTTQVSPGARIAAMTLVRNEDDSGENNFDPNEDSSEEEDANENDTSTLGPVSRDSSSAFQFNLAAGSMKSSSPTSTHSSLTPASAHSIKSSNSKSKISQSSDDFQIIMPRASRSNAKTGNTPKQSETATIASSTSILSNLSLRNKSSATSPSGHSYASNSTAAKFTQQSPSSSGSIRSQQLSSSSTLFPSSSGGGGITPVSVLSGRSRGSNRKRKGNNNSKSQATSITSATSPMSDHSSLMTGVSSASSPSQVSTKRQQAKLILSRAFGRHSLPSDLQPWKVEVSPAEWDSSESCWKYRIQVQNQQTPPHSPSSASATWRSLESFVWLEHALNVEFQGGLVLPLLSIAVGMTDLEHATPEVEASLLRNWLSDILNGIRGQGELLLQHKSIDLLRSEAVEAFLYRNSAPLQKTGDLIMSIMGDSIAGDQFHQNGLRRLEQKGSEHHFRQNSENDTEGGRHCNGVLREQLSQSPQSNPLSPCTPRSQQMLDEEEPDLIDSLWTRGPLAIMTGELCGVRGCNEPDDSPSSAGSSSVSSPDGHNKKYGRYTCTSRAIGTADTLNIQDSFVDVSTVASMQSSIRDQRQKSPQPPRLWKLAQYPLLIKSERGLILSYRRTAMSTIEKAETLLDEEGHIGTAWKRFGIAISNLFSYEKEVESARLGDKKIHRDHMPYRKVKKSTIDECLRVVAQQKVDRSVPPLRALKAMLIAYNADLSSASPSVDAYLGGLSQMALFEEEFAAKHLQQHGHEGNSALEGSSTIASTSPPTKSKAAFLGNWQEQLRSLAKSKGDDEKKTDDVGRVLQSGSSTSTSECDKLSSSSTAIQRKRVVEQRILANERLLKDSLTTLCKSANLRTARMAWAYFKGEATQCSLLHSAARSLRNNIDLPDKESVSKMVSRHHDENKQDMKTELALVQRMVNLGNMKKFPIAGAATANEAETIEVDSDNQDEERAKALLRDEALQVARERVGRWNSQLAMAVMKAVGVDDANVRVEETTRELRLVRKYAIGLRENLNRCIEAVELLRNAILKGRQNKSHDQKSSDGLKTTRHICETRKEFLSELTKLLSGVYISDSDGSKSGVLSQASLKVLAKAGVKINDPFGWRSPFGEGTKDGNAQGGCGEAAVSYVEFKDSQTERLLSSLSGLLNEYTQRVEVVESFVYMECVGVQLEKHFSQKRADALSAFEKKTDITTAINIATRKRIPALVEELQSKMKRFGPEVSHTSVKETKEAHLESKSVKTELHELALRRLLRARETSTERVINLLEFWVKEEESACISELNLLGDALEVLEKAFGT